MTSVTCATCLLLGSMRIWTFPRAGPQHHGILAWRLHIYVQPAFSLAVDQASVPQGLCFRCMGRLRLRGSVLSMRAATARMQERISRASAPGSASTRRGIRSCVQQTRTSISQKPHIVPATATGHSGHEDLAASGSKNSWFCKGRFQFREPAVANLRPSWGLVASTSTFSREATSPKQLLRAPKSMQNSIGIATQGPLSEGWTDPCA